jgi:hypothetical protein
MQSLIVSIPEMNPGIRRIGIQPLLDSDREHIGLSFRHAQEVLVWKRPCERFENLRTVALASLGFTGEVWLVEVDPSDNRSRLGPTDAITPSNDDASYHEIHALRDSYATNGTILHEFCSGFLFDRHYYLAV